jgi:hypothetical protein
VLRGVRRLLHDEGYTIKGVQKLYREGGLKRLAQAGEGALPPKEAAAPVTVATPTGGTEGLTQALNDLLAAKSRLDGLLKK